MQEYFQLCCWHHVSVPARSVVMAACDSLERALKESISNVLERFDGVEKLSDEQASAVFNFIQWKKSLLFQLIPGLCLRLNQMGSCNYPKSAIVTVVTLSIESLIKCHVKELRQQGISCTSLSGDDAGQDGALTGKYAFVCKPRGAYPERKMEEDASVAHLSKQPVWDCCRWSPCYS